MPTQEIIYPGSQRVNVQVHRLSACLIAFFLLKKCGANKKFDLGGHHFNIHCVDTADDNLCD